MAEETKGKFECESLEQMGLTGEAEGGLNLRAFLRLIRWAERYPLGGRAIDDYFYKYGNEKFVDSSDHPGKSKNSAAGGYMFIYKTWTQLKKHLKLPDFSPLSQDKGAIALLKEKGALKDVRQGKIKEAIDKVGGTKVWAALPGEGQQSKITMPDCEAMFKKFKDLEASCPSGGFEPSLPAITKPINFEPLLITVSRP